MFLVQVERFVLGDENVVLRETDMRESAWILAYDVHKYNIKAPPEWGADDRMDRRS
jgi:hypothetical protein